MQLTRKDITVVSPLDRLPPKPPAVEPAAQTPSASDVAQSLYPGVVYIIVSLAESNLPVARAFYIDGGRYYEIALKTM